MSALVAAMAGFCMGPVVAADSPGDLEGFSSAAAAAEMQLEQRFDSDLSAADLRAWLEQMTSAPNHVGSPHDKANAEFELAKFKEWGWDASIETFSVLYPTPKEVSVELVAPTHFKATLTEPPIEGDRTSTQTKDELPAYNVYGADGDVTAELVYVNQGMPDDYKELEREGISVKGRIVLTRYGGGWRGLKPKLAYEHGAVGCLIYSDPRDDGYGAGDVYPKGGYRPPDAVQRGSVQDMTLYSGDPLTPGVGAVPGAKRLALKDAKTILKIPVLPLSYAAAEPLLAALGGRVAQPSWRGGLPLTYHVGPGPAKVHMKVLSDWTQKPLYDVVAKIRGSEAPDQWIIRGNHHDGWVFGALRSSRRPDRLDGGSQGDRQIGAARLAAAPYLGVRQLGWRRAGLVGLHGMGRTACCRTESESRALRQFRHQWSRLSASRRQPCRAALFERGGAGLKDPETGGTVLARALAERRVSTFDSTHPNSAAPAGASGDLHLGALGSGSDFTPFLQHVGVNSVNLGFEGETQYGVYHSAYDSFDHFRRFVDPTFEYGVTLAKVAGRIMLRAAQADLIPARESDFAAQVAAYDEELHKLADGMRTKTTELTSCWTRIPTSSRRIPTTREVRPSVSPKCPT